MEMDGTISGLKFAAFRVIPYHLRTAASLPEASTSLEEVNRPMEPDRMTGDSH
jgi:hypothetical protein